MSDLVVALTDKDRMTRQVPLARWLNGLSHCRVTSSSRGFGRRLRRPLMMCRSPATADDSTPRKQFSRGWLRWKRSELPAGTSSSMTAERVPLDIDRLLATLERHEVDFLLVGGVAAIAHGALRPTDDLDCLVRRSGENLARLAAAMRELHVGSASRASPTQRQLHCRHRSTPTRSGAWRSRRGALTPATSMSSLISRPETATGFATRIWLAAPQSRTFVASPYAWPHWRT
jgi:hypothetical protein